MVNDLEVCSEQLSIIMPSSNSEAKPFNDGFNLVKPNDTVKIWKILLQSWVLTNFENINWNETCPEGAAKKIKHLFWHYWLIQFVGSDVHHNSNIGLSYLR